MLDGSDSGAASGAVEEGALVCCASAKGVPAKTISSKRIRGKRIRQALAASRIAKAATFALAPEADERRAAGLAILKMKFTFIVTR